MFNLKGVFMKKSLLEIAKNIGVHYTTILRLSKQELDDLPCFPEFEIIGSKLCYDEEAVSAWYIKYKTKDKRTTSNRMATASSLVKLFLKDIPMEQIDGSLYYCLEAIYKKIKHHEIVTNNMFCKYIKKNCAQQRYIKHTCAELIALVYLKFRDSSQNNVIRIGESYIVKGDIIHRNSNDLNIVAKGVVKYPKDTMPDEIALDLCKREKY
jgi:hypothetical protein